MVVLVLMIDEDGEMERDSGSKEGLRERLWERERERLAIVSVTSWVLWPGTGALDCD